MTTRIIWSAEAQADLDEIYDFIARDSPRYAEVVIRSLLAAPARIGDFPQAGRVVPEFQRADVREIVWQAYRLVYQLQGGEAAVLTVFHAARLMPHIRFDPGYPVPTEW